MKIWSEPWSEKNKLENELNPLIVSDMMKSPLKLGKENPQILPQCSPTSHNHVLNINRTLKHLVNPYHSVLNRC